MESETSKAATRVADVLLALAEGKPLGVSELARRTESSKTSVHRIAQALTARGLLAQDQTSRAYVLGLAAIALGGAALRRSQLVGVALPVLQALRDETGETGTISVLAGLKRIYLAQVVSPQEVAMIVQVGSSYPLHAGASSKAILAFAQPSVREAVLAGRLVQLTPITPTQREQLEAEICEIARLGYAVSRGEREEGASAVAAPIIGVDGYAIGSVSVSGPTARFPAERITRLAPRVMAAARSISERSIEVGSLDAAGSVASAVTRPRSAAHQRT